MQFKRYRDLVIVLLALAVPFWFLRASMRDPKQASGPDKVLVVLSTPIQNAAAMLAHGLSDVWGDYVYLVDVKEDNAKLASENARLREKVRELERHEVEARRLKRLLAMRDTLRTDAVSAQVIGKNTTDFFRVTRVVLDREARDIGPNLPVLSPDGVVGTTLKTAGDTVDVRLVVDAGAAVDVVVQRTGARGIARGTGDETKYAITVEYMQRTDEVEIGDLLVTSGVGRRFPKGIPVGTVSKVVKRDFGIYQQVVAVPAVDFSRLEDVVIVTSGGEEPAAQPDRAAREAPGAAPKKQGSP
ncbi:MAG TPA: rod shape-determining protein MreC [Minicystis sp.]|nr:rod shape-determining protein MreC [Minicystis sp.]